MADRRYPIIFLVTFLVLALVSEARAQNIPPGQEPGAQASRFQLENERKIKDLERRKTKAPAMKLEEPAEEPSMAGAPETSFMLKDINITGMKTFNSADFRSKYERYIDKEVSFKDIGAIVESIKSAYKKKGYMTTSVYVPEQDIKEGVVEIRVAEGDFGELKVEGNKYFGKNLLTRYIHAKKNSILNLFELQKDIMRLNQNPDIQATTVISAGATPGTSDISLKIVDKFPFHAGASFDNQGTRLTGKDRTSFTLRDTNITGHNDLIFANSQKTRSSTGQFISYLLPVNTYGSKLGLDFTYFDMKLGYEYKDFDITGKTIIATPHLDQELILADKFQADVDIGMDIKSIVKKTGRQITANDQLRLPYIDFNFTGLDSVFGGGQTTFSPRFTLGTSSFLGASKRNYPTSSRQGTGGAYFAYEQSLGRFQRMPFESYLIVRSLLQVPSTEVSPSEQIQLGGENSIRGYPEGDYLADWGAQLNADWVFPMYLIPKEWKFPHADQPMRNQIQPVAFMDIGGGKLRKPQPGELKQKFLMGLGGGIRVSLYNKIGMRFEWAKDVGDKPTSGSGPSTFYVVIQGEI